MPQFNPATGRVISRLPPARPRPVPKRTPRINTRRVFRQTACFDQR